MPFENSRCAAPRASHTKSQSARLMLAFIIASLAVTTVSAAQGKQNPASADEALIKTETVEVPPITIADSGETRAIKSGPTTVQALLTTQNIHLNEHDRCTPPLSATVKPGMRIAITRIRIETTVVRTPLPFATKQKLVGSMPVGTKKVLQTGHAGERVTTYRVCFKDGKETERLRVKETAHAPVAQYEVVGTRGMTLASRGYFAGRRVIEMVATGYGPSGNGKWGMQTATGLRSGFGVVAVDPRFIPLGTRLYIDGYGYAVAGDTGGAIKGNRIDLGYDDEATASAVGRKHVRVLVLD